MKPITFFLIVLATLCFHLPVQADHPTTPIPPHGSPLYFMSPNCGSTLLPGLLTVQVGYISTIRPKYVDLFINGKLVGRDQSAPFVWQHDPTNRVPNYSWSKNNTHLLSLYQTGKYSLRARMVYLDANNIERTEETTCTIFVELYCYGKLHFVYPNSEQVFKVGSTVNVGVDESSDFSPSFDALNLYLNGQFIGRDTQTPFRWSGNDYPALRNMQQGTYKLTARGTDKCGNRKSIYQTFYVY